MSGPASKPDIVTDRLDLYRCDGTYAPLVLDYLLFNRQAHQPWQPLRDADYYTLDRQRALLEPSATAIHYLVFRSQDRGRVIGDVHFSNIIHGFLSACFLGYSMDSRAYGQGLMTEALAAAIPHVFRETGLHRITAHVMPANAASIRILEKLGFEREGYFREYLKINGRWEDHLAFSLLSGSAE